MGITSLFNRFRRLARELRTANGANVTITFALAAIPIVGFVGAAVDYSRANSVKSAMQASADATALMLSKVASGMTTTDLQTKGLAYFQALFNRPDATGLQVNVTYSTTNGSQVIVTATANVKTDFMNLVGKPTMKVGVDSDVKWGNSRLRVALVLDNTGSMNDYNKIGALKTATNNLLTQLKSAAANNGDVYVSIIPFVKDVNVGASNYKATWIDWTDWDANNGTCSGNGNGTGNGNAYGWGNGNANGWGNGNYYGVYGKSGCSGTWTPAAHSTWNGCVVDRGNSSGPSSLNTDTNVIAPDITKPDTLYAAEQYSYCPAAAVMPLSYDWTAMSNLVNSMVANGSTNQALGLQLAWQSLVGGGPFPAPPAMDSNYKYSQVIILLTDGLNTQDRWYTNQPQIDARQTITCANIKAAGITLYTVQVNTDGDPTSTLLQQCASDSSKFFLLTSSTQIVSTFQQIGTNLSNLRIAK